MRNIFRNQRTGPERKLTGTAPRQNDARCKQGRLILKIFFTLLLASTFLISGGLFFRDIYRSSQEREANQKLVRLAELQESQGISESEAENIMASEEISSAEPEQKRNYLPLVTENADLTAWLTIEGTEVDYPVMYTPDNPEYYLHRAFDGSYALSGSLFIAADCIPNGTNIIIYGHKMKDGSMFGGLDAYTDAAYAREHSEIVYDLIQPDGSYERLTFEVMAVFYSRVYTVDEENVFRYYYGTDLSDPEIFQNYIEEAMSASLFDLGVTAEYGDRLLTLSTCSYHTEDGRFVVVARQCS